MQSNGSTASGEFKWKRSDESFAFNFLLESIPSGTHNTMAPEKAQSTEGTGSDSTSGFTFNFQIPTGTEGTTHSSELQVEAMEAENTEAATTQSTEPIPDTSNTKTGKKKKKKKKKEEGAEDKPQKTMNKATEEAPKEESTELTPEQQLSRELDWCIEQLELGLRTQKSSNKQREEAIRALKTLHSSRAPVVKKRQVMRAVSGDYRRKMEAERDRQFKLIHSAMTSARVTAVSEPSHKPVFCYRASSSRQTTAIAENPRGTCGLSVEPVEGENESFVLRPSHEEFRFNFDL